MASNTTDRRLVWVVLTVIAAFIILPAVSMGFGMMGVGPMMGNGWGHGMWSSSDGAPGWMFVVSAGLRLLFLVLLVGAGYLGYRTLTSRSADSSLEELRSAYARGDLDDEEFERRRERLDSDQ